MKTAALIETSSLSLPNDCYVYQISLINAKLAAISSDDSLRIIDPNTLRERGVRSQVHDGVTCSTALDHDNHCLLTAGRDTAIRSWDLRSAVKNFEIISEPKAPCLSLASSSFNIAVGTELSHSQAVVTLWDQRNPSRPSARYVESHSDDITELQFHPTNPSRLLSGSTDGLVNIYDISISEEDDALLHITNHGTSISHAGFFLDRQFFALSHDENFSMYHFEEKGSDPPPADFGDLRSELSCEYVIDVVPAVSGREAIIGAGSHTKQSLDLIPLRSSGIWKFDQKNTIHLQGAHGEDIVRSVWLDDKNPIIFTAGEDGRIKAWRKPKDDDAGEQDQQVEAERPRKRKKKEAMGDKVRFTPY